MYVCAYVRTLHIQYHTYVDKCLMSKYKTFISHTHLMVPLLQCLVQCGDLPLVDPCEVLPLSGRLHLTLLQLLLQLLHLQYSTDTNGHTHMHTCTYVRTYVPTYCMYVRTHIHTHHMPSHTIHTLYTHHTHMHTSSFLRASSFFRKAITSIVSCSV